MRVVVFDRELHEPLTVLDVPNWLAARAKDGDRIRFAVPEDIAASYAEVTAFEMADMRICSFTFEAVYRHSRNTKELLFWYAYADQPELTLKLRAAFLPGQLGEVQRRERQAWFMGLLAVPLS